MWLSLLNYRYVFEYSSAFWGKSISRSFKKKYFLIGWRPFDAQKYSNSLKNEQTFARRYEQI